MDFSPIDIPPGNEIKGFFPIAQTDTAKEASSLAHEIIVKHKVSVSWQPIGDEFRQIGFAVYVCNDSCFGVAALSHDIGGEG